MQKTLLVVLSDPKSGTEEALGRVFNAMAMAYDLQERSADVRLVLQGTATRWASELSKPEHALHALYSAISGVVDGACGGCADVFGATESVEQVSLPLLRDLVVPGTTGLTSLGRYLADGYSIITF
jgi:hypothetical protein